jgi:NAD(P) transhydrogenase subunit alpha
MRIAVVREALATDQLPLETRVAATPDSVKRLKALGFEIAVETGAGEAANFPDASYVAAGATISTDPRENYATADILLKVRPLRERDDLGAHEVDLLQQGATVLGFFYPGRNAQLLERACARNLTVLAMECVPRISRAQKMDALSSQANIAGYRAVLEAANRFGSFFTGQMTAAGKVPPAKVLVIGAGVAGLAALGTAKGLGAIIRSFDTRAAVREQIESMGGEFLEVTFKEDGDGGGGYAKEMSPAFLEAEYALFRQQAKEVDIVITTALIPGKPAPKLWFKDMVELMKPGSVIVDMAAESGGNCDVTVANEVVVHNGVIVLGFTDLAGRLPTTASNLYGQNLVHLLTDMGGATGWKVDFDDEVVRGATVTHQGAITWPPPAKAVVAAAAPAPKPAAVAAPVAVAVVEAPAPVKSGHGHGKVAREHLGSARTAPLTWVAFAILVVAYLGLSTAGTDVHGVYHFAQQLTIFVLACFVGVQVIWSVTPALHTPLMSVTNAISGIIVVGGMLHMHGQLTTAAPLLALFAVLFATINIGGGFLVTRRMLRMFHK